MFRHKILSIGAPLLASVAMLFTSGTSEAAGRGGGGGGRGGGGGYRGGYGGGYRGGYAGYRGYGYGGYRGYGYGYRGYGYGGVGYYGGLGYYYPYYAGYPYTDAYPDYSASYSPAPAVYQSFYAAPAAVTAPNNKALIDVNVPADAAIWIDGNPTKQTGASREYVTPALTPGQNYSYELKARWMENGQPVEKTQKVRFQAGNQVVVNFP